MLAELWVAFSGSTTRTASQIVVKMRWTEPENRPACLIQRPGIKGCSGGWSAEVSSLNGLLHWIGRQQGMMGLIDGGDVMFGVLCLLLVGKLPWLKLYDS